LILGSSHCTLETSRRIRPVTAGRKKNCGEEVMKANSRESTNSRRNLGIHGPESHADAVPPNSVSENDATRRISKAGQIQRSPESNAQTDEGEFRTANPRAAMTIVGALNDRKIREKVNALRGKRAEWFNPKARLRSGQKGSEVKDAAQTLHSHRDGEVSAALASASVRTSLGTEQQDLLDKIKKKHRKDRELLAKLDQLVNTDAFQNLDPVAQTAILSQTANYPDTRSVDNLRRLIGKDWFRSYSDPGDQQRAAKIVAFLSQYDRGDSEIIKNTLDSCLADNAPFRFDFVNYASSTLLGSAADDQFHFNRAKIPADNKKMDLASEAAIQVATLSRPLRFSKGIQ
jgi:hypothetical protein